MDHISICPQCGEAFDEAPIIVNTKLDGQYTECFWCHCTNLGTGKETMCEKCDACFTPDKLEMNPINHLPEICPYCSEVWCG